MRKLFGILGVIGVYGLFLLPGKVCAEEIRDYDVRITVQKSGKISISEIIDYDFGSIARHGIFRNVPIYKYNAQNKRFKLDVKLDQVLQDGKQAYFTSSSTNGVLAVKIGSSGTTLVGAHVYQIDYEVGGALTYFSDHDELYWNSIGTDWAIPIQNAHSSVSLPDSISPALLTARCYTGHPASEKGDCSIGIKESRVNSSSNTRLMPNTGLGVVVTFPKGVVSVLEPREAPLFWESPLGRLGILGLLGLALVWYVGMPFWLAYRWFTKGRDPFVGIPVRAGFDIPEVDGRKLLPAEVGAVIDEKIDTKELTATLVDLARRGYLKIVEKDKKTFSLERTAKDEMKLESFEQKLLTDIFGTSLKADLKGSTWITSYAAFTKELYERVKVLGLFPENPNTLRARFQVAFLVLGLVTFNFPLAVAAIVFGAHMPRKTYAGAQAAQKSLGLRNFLKSQERQLAFQADRQMMFEKLLPHAIVFGVEKIWIERFKDMNLQSPDWYVGKSDTFNSALFYRGIHATSSALASSTTPHTSSSGFSSGSGGGGFSGGGGGGGGGSW